MNQPILPAHEHQVVTCLASAYRVPVGPLAQVLEACAARPGVRWPFAPEAVRMIGERLPLIAEVLYPKPRSSKLLAYLNENPDDVLLLFDAYKSGKEGLFFVRFAQGHNDPANWLSRMTRRVVLANEVGPDLIIAAPAASFAV